MMLMAPFLTDSNPPPAAELSEVCILPYYEVSLVQLGQDAKFLVPLSPFQRGWVFFCHSRIALSVGSPR